MSTQSATSPRRAEVAPTEQRPPFFVMGCRRSGTTLVGQLLDSHSRLAVYHESYYYPIFSRELRWYGDLRRARNLNRLIEDLRETIRVQRVQPPSADELRNAVAEPSFPGVLTALLQVYASQRGKARAGDKTPEHYRFLPEILEHFPESPVVFVVRDPRDTIASILKNFGTSLDDAIRSWNEAWQSSVRAGDRVHLVRYEELVHNPEQVVRGICDHLGEPFEEGVFTFHERIPEWFRRPGGKLDEPVNTTSIGNFRKMDPATVAAIEAGCAAGMEALGYRFVGDPPAAALRRVPQAVAPPSFPILMIERLRYYGTNRVRWQRGWLRWKTMLRVRAHYFATRAASLVHG